TLVALAENSAKLVPRPSQVAPSGCGLPAVISPLDLRNEKDGSKGWKDKVQLRAVTRHNGRHRSRVPDIAAAVSGGICIQDLAPIAGEGHADAVVVARLRREIDGDEATRFRIGAFAQPGKDALVGIVGDQPLEAAGVAVELVQRRQLTINPVEIANEPLHTRMRRIVEQVPRQALLVVPFAVLAELAAHEQKLLAGMPEHEGVVGAQIGEAL